MCYFMDVVQCSLCIWSVWSSLVQLADISQVLARQIVHPAHAIMVVIDASVGTTNPGVCTHLSTGSKLLAAAQMFPVSCWLVGIHLRDC